MKILAANPAFSINLGNGLERYKLGSGMRYPWSLLKRSDECPRYAMFPLFLAYTAALVEQNGFDVKVIDSVPINLNNSDFIKKVRELFPDIILFEPNAAIYDDLMDLLIRLRKECTAKFVVVGSHVTASINGLLENFSQIDFAVVGEYELAFLELMRALRDGTSYENIKGLAFRDHNGSIKQNGRTDSIENLDDLPLPARHLFPAYLNKDMSLYNDGFCQYSPAYHMHTSRGCNFRCNFCDRVNVLFGAGKQRFFSPKRVVEEMSALVEMGAKEIYIDDDNFTSNKNHTEMICEEMLRKRISIPWSAMCDAMSLDRTLLKKMADAGCIGIKFGLDSADIKVLHSINKPLKIKNLEEIVSYAKSLKIKTHMSVVFGLSGETKDSMHSTFRYACRLDIDSIQFSLATPLPGTPFYSDLLRSRSLLSTKWSDLDGANRSVIKYSDMSKEYIESFMAKSHSRWLRRKILNPGWIIRQASYSKGRYKSQGFTGIYKRAARAIQLIIGDARTVKENNSEAKIRY